MAYILAAQAGSFESTSTWVGGVVPATGDIACCGIYRITINQSNSATLSTSNVDWVLGGGTTLPTTNTGGFTIAPGITCVIPSYRFEYYKSTGSSSGTSAPLYISSGIVTITDATEVLGGETSASQVAITWSSSDVDVLTVTKVTLRGNTSPVRSICTFLDLAPTPTAKYILNLGQMTSIDGTPANSRFLSSGNGGITGVINFNGPVPPTDAVNGVNVNISNMTGNSIINFYSGFNFDGPGKYPINVTAKTINIPGGVTLVQQSSSSASGNISINATVAGTIETGVQFQGRTSRSLNIVGIFTINGNVTRVVNYNNTSITSIGINLGPYSSLTVNGDVITDATTITYAISTDTAYNTITANPSTIIVINGNIIQKGNAPISVYGTVGPKSLYISGNVDLSLHSNTLCYPRAIIVSNNMTNLTIGGDILPPVTGSYYNTSYGLITLTASSINTVISFNGVTSGGNYCPALVITSSDAGAHIYIKKIHTLDGLVPGSTSVIPCIRANQSTVVTDELVCGEAGRYPVEGTVVFSNNVVPVFQLRRENGAIVNMVEYTPGANGLAHDIREGVTIGGMVGTLSVPAATDVRYGVPVDTTTGVYSPLSPDYDARFIALRTALLAVKAQTDQLAFTSNELNVNVVDDTASMSVDIGHIKEQTDKINFTGDIEVFGPDPLWGNVTFSCDFENSPISNIKDNSSLSVVAVSLLDGLFGKSGSFSKATGSEINTVSSIGLIPSTGDFTIEMFIKIPELPSAGTVMMICSLENGFNFEIRPDGKLGIFMNNNSTYTTTTNNVIVAGAWKHVALSRVGGNITIHTSGLLELTVANSMAISSSGKRFYLGRDASAMRYFEGLMDNVCVTSGVSRYPAGPYTVPTVPYPNTVPTGVFKNYVLADGANSSASASAGGTTDLSPVISALSSVSNNVLLVKAKTDGIVDYTSRFNSIDGSLTIIDSDISDVDSKAGSVKAKTDQLTFSANGVVADSGNTGRDYSTVLSSISATMTAMESALNLIEETTSKIAFEEVRGEGDSIFEKVVYLAEMNGTNGSASYTPELGGSMVMNTSRISSINARVGTTSLKLNGNSSVDLSTNTIYNFGSNDFTVELSFMATSIPSPGSYAGIVGKRNSNSETSWTLLLAGSVISLVTAGTNAVSINSTVSASPNTWYDISISRSADSLTLCVNGVTNSSACTGLVCASVSSPLMLGKLSYDISSNYFTGYIDHIRISVGLGAGRYSVLVPSISPPVKEYPLSSGGAIEGYKVIANYDDSGASIPADLEERLNDLKARINAVHFAVDG